MTRTKTLQITEDVKGVSAYVVAPFDVALSTLKEAGYEPISLEQNAKLRMQEGQESYVSRQGNWVREGVLYTPDKRVLLTKNSPILENAVEATQAHRSGNWFYVTDEQVEKARENSVDLKGKEVPTNRFADDARTVFMFGESAKDYGNFLRENRINEIPIFLSCTQNKPYVNQVWFRYLDGRSFLNGGSRSLDDEFHSRGVRSSGGA